MEIAKDKSGTKKPLSFRDVVRLCIVDETSIQSETSPAESGDITLAPLERNVFKYMLTGEDDAALITQLKPKDYATGRNAQVRMLDDMILELDAEIADSRSEEHTSELQSLMRTSYAVFCLKKKRKKDQTNRDRKKTDEYMIERVFTE